jgi:signal transduction histidine kinase
MSTVLGRGLHPALRAFPGAVLELSPGGVVLESNGRLERALERTLVGNRFEDVLDGPSQTKWRELLAAMPRDGGDAELWELTLEGRDTVTPHGFYPVREVGEGGALRIWLVESPRDPRFEQLHMELMAVSSEQNTTQRQLAKEKARLATALAEVEREFVQNEGLSRTLQATNEEMEAQNQELMAMTEELHAGREHLLQLNYQLERRTRELQMALGARTRFYASMSHELRTPINAVVGYNDLLLAGIYGPLGEQQELAVERSQRAARHLREMVNDVLDISRLEGGKLELEPQEVRVQELVDDILVSMRPMAQERGTELHVMTQDCPEAVVTDPRRARQILINLVSNAIKFGGGRPVVVHCGRGADGGLVFDVVDQGDGIAAEDLGRIFDEFVQLRRGENGETAPHEGTGLGLPIARRLARLIGGAVDVSSTPGVGSTFRLSLPPSLPAQPRG